MPALVFHGPGDLRLEDVPDPVPDEGELLIEVEVALTDGTDLKAFRRGHPVLLGRDHWAASWSVLIGGGGLKGGLAVGETDKDGLSITSETYLPGDLWATVAHALRIPLSTVHTSTRGRPMKIANGGNPIKPLLT